MNRDFTEMLGALCDQQAEFLVVGAYALAAKTSVMSKCSGMGAELLRAMLVTLRCRGLVSYKPHPP